MIELTSTIVARASASGCGTRAVIRLSGDGCRALRTRIAGDAPFRRGARTARLRTPAGSIPCIEFTALAPRSATGEDTLELLLPANDSLLAAVEGALATAAREAAIPLRQAAPGEFTLRAFARGRIDLTQAEGIAAAIAATNAAQVRAARQLADGGLGRFASGLAERVAHDLALVEAGIDFTDQEDVVAIAPEALAADLDAMRSTLRARLAGSVAWERFEATPRVVLVGAPNAGKSTLFNALLGRRRVVASPIAGTTRDAIEERVTIEGARSTAEILLVDVAGLDESADRFQPAMRDAADAAIDRADLVLLCSAPDAPVSAAAREAIAAHAPEAPVLAVGTKADLGSAAGFTHDGPHQECDLCVSATRDRGMSELREAILRRIAARAGDLGGETLVLAERHRAALAAALDALDDAASLVATQGLRSPELVAASLRLALDALGTIGGAIAPDDVLGRIFGKFCVGK
jgi:tRNA modification GTPase